VGAGSALSMCETEVHFIYAHCSPVVNLHKPVTPRKEIQCLQYQQIEAGGWEWVILCMCETEAHFICAYCSFSSKSTWTSHSSKGDPMCTVLANRSWRVGRGVLLSMCETEVHFICAHCSPVVNLHKPATSRKGKYIMKTCPVWLSDSLCHNLSMLKVDKRTKARSSSLLVNVGNIEIMIGRRTAKVVIIFFTLTQSSHEIPPLPYLLQTLIPHCFQS
jgi:hypothetical protein